MQPTSPQIHRCVTPELPERPTVSHFEIKWAPSVIRITYARLKDAIWRHREAFHLACDENNDEKKQVFLEKMQSIQAQMSQIENDWEKKGFKID